MKNDEVNHEGTDRLVPLSNSKDFKVAKDNPDVRGWRVVGADGEKLGLVKDLVVDTQEMKVRYLAVTADRRFYNDNYDRYLLVPIGSAALDKRGNKVFISNINSNSIANYPTYHGGPITEDYEYAVREALLHSSDRNNNYRTDTDTLRTDNDSYRNNTDAIRNDNDSYKNDNDGIRNDNDSYRNDNDVIRNDNDTFRNDTDTFRNDKDNNATVRTDYATNEPASVTPRPISTDFYNNDNYNESRFYNSNRDEDNDNRSTFSQENINTEYYPDQNNKNNFDGSDNKQNVEESISTIERLEQLRERGSITEEEFKALKKRALNL